MVLRLRLRLRRLSRCAQRTAEQRPQLVLAIWLFLILLVIIHGRLRNLDAVQADEHDAALFARAFCLRFKCSSSMRVPTANAAVPLVAPKRGMVQYVETKMNGFGAQFLRRVDALALASVLGYDFGIATRRYWNHGCAPWQGWSCYFTARYVANERADCTELEDWSTTNTNSPDCLRISTTRSMARTAAVLLTSSMGTQHLSRVLAHELWDLNAATRAEVDALVDDMGLPAHFVGVHVRRGDKVSEVRAVPLRVYARAVRCVSQPGVVVFISSDDGDSVARLRRMLSAHRARVFSAHGVANRRGHSQLLFNQRYMRRNRPHITALLADITALARADVFIGTLSSNLGRTVHLLRQQEANTTFSLDDMWEPGTAWRSFGKPFCQHYERKRSIRTFCRCMTSISEPI